MDTTLTDNEFAREAHIRAAAYVETEGAIVIGRYMNGKRYQYSARVRVTCTDPRLTAWLYKNFGGTVFFQEGKGKHKGVHRWTIYTQGDIEHFLTLILPHMLIKTDQVNTVLEFLKEAERVKRDIPVQEREPLLAVYYEKMKQLNHRGNDA